MGNKTRQCQLEGSSIWDKTVKASLSAILSTNIIFNICEPDIPSCNEVKVGGTCHEVEHTASVLSQHPWPMNLWQAIHPPTWHTGALCYLDYHSYLPYVLIY